MPFAPSAPTSTLARTVSAPDPRGDAGLVELEHLDSRAVPQLRARLGGLLCEVRVQAAALRHADQRLAVAAGEARPVAEPELEAVDVSLDDG